MSGVSLPKKIGTNADSSIRFDAGDKQTSPEPNEPFEHRRSTSSRGQPISPFPPPSRSVLISSRRTRRKIPSRSSATIPLWAILEQARRSTLLQLEGEAATRSQGPRIEVGPELLRSIDEDNGRWSEDSREILIQKGEDKLGVSSQGEFYARIEQSLWEHSVTGKGWQKWSVEIISWSISALCMAGILCILYTFQGRSPPHWPLQLTLDRCISILSSLALASLLFSITPVFGYSRTRWFEELSAEEGVNLDVIGLASRGPWGSFLLLLRAYRVSLFLTSLATLLLTCAFDFMPQHVIFLGGPDSEISAEITEEQYPLVEVQWLWLALPLGSIVLRFIVLVVAIVRSWTEHKGKGVLRNSDLATVHGFPVALQEQIAGTSATKASQAKQEEKKHIRPPKGWRRVVEGVVHGFKECLIAIGYLEPPLKPEVVRLRWKCRCGEQFSVDAREYQPGGASELTAFVEALVGSQVVATQFSSTSTNQAFIYPQPRLWLQRVFARLGLVSRLMPRQSTLPQHNLNAVAHAPPGSIPQPPKLLHLLACIRSAQLGNTVHQDCIDTIDTDRTLFCYLRQLFKRHRGRFCTLLSLKKVQGIHFVKFNLFTGGSVEVRHHSHCCDNTCECIPPQSRVEPSDRAEYRCKPAGPLKSGPPVLPDLLAHFFTNPSCIPEHNISILNRLPKRICGELQGSAEDPAEGWGLYFHEGWNADVISMVAFVMFVGGSLLFGVLWSCLKMDVQGAFGVSAYIMTANAILISLVATRVGRT